MNSQFIDITWLSTFGLTGGNVLDYFYQSPFYDSAANNEIVRSQGVSTDHLRAMIGMEYAVDDARSCPPHLFVIKQQVRRSQNTVETTNYFYCLDGIIYQSPVFIEVLRSRLRKLSLQLLNSYRAAKQWHVDTCSGSIDERLEGSHTHLQSTDNFFAKRSSSSMSDFSTVEKSLILLDEGARTVSAGNKKRDRPIIKAALPGSKIFRRDLEKILTTSS